MQLIGSSIFVACVYVELLTCSYHVHKSYYSIKSPNILKVT